MFVCEVNAKEEGAGFQTSSKRREREREQEKKIEMRKKDHRMRDESNNRADEFKERMNGEEVEDEEGREGSRDPNV